MAGPFLKYFFLCCQGRTLTGNSISKIQSFADKLGSSKSPYKTLFALHQEGGLSAIGREQLESYSKWRRFRTVGVGLLPEGHHWSWGRRILLNGGNSMWRTKSMCGRVPWPFRPGCLSKEKAQGKAREEEAMALDLSQHADCLRLIK